MLRMNRDRTAAARPRDRRAAARIVAAGLLLGAVAVVMLRTAGEWLMPGTADAGQAATAPAAAAQPGPAAKAAPAGPAASAPKPGAAAATTAKTTGGSAKAGAVVHSPAHLDAQVAYQYNALGRRDPFQSLLSGEYVGSEEGVSAPPDIGGIKVVGIVWGDADQFALVEDARGDSHILRRGDKVMNGYIETLKRDALIVNLTLDGQSQSVRVPLTRKGDKANANR